MMKDMDELLKLKFEKPLQVRMPSEAHNKLHPSTQLHEKRRELDSIEQTLQSKQTDYSVRMEILEQRAIELAKKEQAIKTWLYRYDKFLRENTDKRDRALKKAVTERFLQQQKDKEIKKLRKETEMLLLLKAKIKQRVDKNSIYHQYLEKVLHYTDEFTEMREILDRHETLVMTHADLLVREQKNEDMIDHIKNMTVKYVEEMQTEILGCNNRLSELQTAYDEAHVQAVQWESTWTHIKNTAAKKTLLLGQVKLACHNLYQIILRVSKRGMFGERVPMTDDTKLQLLKIKEVMEDLAFVINEVKKNRELLAQQPSDIALKY